MTIANENGRDVYTGNGSTTVYPYTFPILFASEIDVYSSGILRTLGTDYSVSVPAGGGVGNVTWVTAPAQDVPILHLRDEPITQTMDLSVGGDFSEESIERQHDRHTKVSQMLAELLSRAPLLPLTTTQTGPILGAPGAGQFIKWNAAGTILEPADLPTILGTALGVLPSYTKATLPAGAAAGTLARVTDNVRGVWMSNGTAWVALSGEVVNAKEFGAVGDGTTDDSAALRDAYAAVPPGGVLYVPPGTYRVVAVAEALESHWNTIPPIHTSHVGITLTKSGVRIVGAGSGATVFQLVASAGSTRLSFVFGNSTTNGPLTDLELADLAIDLDTGTNNALGIAQARGALFIGVTRLRIRDVRIFSSTGAYDGAGFNIQNSTDVRLDNPVLSNISTLVSCIYSSNIILNNIQASGFKELIDLDKVNSNVSINGGTAFNGQSNADAAIDANATTGLTVTGVSMRTVKHAFIDFNGKGDISPTWADHLANINRGFQTGSNLTVTGCVGYDIGYDGPFECITLGNQWADINAHPGVDPVSNIRFAGNTWTKVGRVVIKEGFAIRISDTFDDVNVALGPVSPAAIFTNTETDWGTHPGAQRYSDVDLDISGTVIRNTTHGGVTADRIRRFKATGVRIENWATAAGSTGQAIRVQEAQVRATHAEIADNSLVGGYQGLGLNGTIGTSVTFNGAAITAANGASSATITITGWPVSLMDINGVVVVTGGTNFTTGTYRIIAVDPVANTWSLNAVVTTAAGSGMTGTMALQPLLRVKNNIIKGFTNLAVTITGTIIDAIEADQATAYYGTVAAGTDDTRMIFVAPSDAYVYEVALVNASTIAQSDAAYTTYTVHARGEDGTGSAEVVSGTTQVTGGLPFTIYTPTRLQATPITDVDARLTKVTVGDVLTLLKQDTGTGQPSDQLITITRYIAH